MQLDKDLSLISAWDFSSSTLVYHSDNYSQFPFYLGSDGTCTAVVKPIDPACTQSLQDNGGTLKTYYDTSREVVVMEATLPDGSYAGWGWGSSMTNTEMLIFSANGA